MDPLWLEHVGISVRNDTLRFQYGDMLQAFPKNRRFPRVSLKGCFFDCSQPIVE